MNFDLDGGTVLYALGVAFALGALLYFVRDVVFGLSITVTAALLLAAFVAFLVGGLAVDRDVLDVVAYALAALSYAVFLGYVTTRYEPAETGVFLLLAASAALFVGLGYAVREGKLAVDRRTAGYVVIGVAAVSAVLVGADALTGQVHYAAEFDDETTIEISREQAEADHAVGIEAGIGTLTVSNPSPFTRPVDLPPTRGCVVGTATERDRIPIRYDPSGHDAPDRIGGGDERTHEIEVQFPVDTDRAGETTYAIERGTDCDVTREEPTIVVAFGDDVGR